MKLWLRLMGLGSKLGCHQLAERSFAFKNYQFPVCARCTGVLLSSVFAIIFFFIWPLNPALAAIFSLVMFLDWWLQRTKIFASTNTRRFITGLIGGYGWTSLHMYFYQLIYWLAGYLAATVNIHSSVV